MIKDLVRLANNLDSKGLKKEADYLDSLILKLAEEGRAVEVSYQVRKGDTMFDIWKANTAPGTSKTLKDNLDLNGMKEGDLIQPCQMIKIWSTPEYEGGAINPECM
tara:strand:- start:2749 stop:3066 length:318 start_codon:yes stop_codon:yes gene_type:complete